MWNSQCDYAGTAIFETIEVQMSNKHINVDEVEDLGEFIRLHREQRGWSQNELARQADGG